MFGLLFAWEESEKFSVDLVDHFLEVLRTVLELDSVYVEDKEVVLVVLDPVLVALVETCDVVDADALLVFAASLLDLTDEVRNRALEVDEEVWRIHQRHHKVEEVRVVLEVSCAHKTHSVEVRSEYACVFVDGTVLNDDLVEL